MDNIEKSGKQSKRRKPLYLLVPKAGLEPARPLRRGILNPLRLPFRHLGTGDAFNAAFTQRPEAKHA